MNSNRWDMRESVRQGIGLLHVEPVTCTPGLPILPVCYLPIIPVRTRCTRRTSYPRQRVQIREIDSRLEMEIEISSSRLGSRISISSLDSPSSVRCVQGPDRDRSDVLSLESQSRTIKNRPYNSVPRKTINATVK